MPGEFIELIDADGGVHPLDGSAGIVMLYGRRGLFMPPFNLIEDPRPNGVGSVLRRVQVGAREVDLPLLIQAVDFEAHYDLLEQVMGWFDPTRGDVKLRLTRSSGQQRELTGRYIDGLDIQEDEDKIGPNWARTAPTLRIQDPYWYDTADTVLSYAIEASAAGFFPFWPGPLLTSSTVVASPTWLNNGDAEAYPVITITGPGQDPVLLNLTTGQTLELGLTLVAGESVVIDTRPAWQRGGLLPIRDQDGASLFSALSNISELWTFGRGSTAFQAQLNAATVASGIELRLKQRWLAP